jgi:imidazolonepropionase-like amidohydrolase
VSIQAGIDLIQHPEALTPRLMPDDIVDLIVNRKVISAVLSNTVTGPAWQRHLKRTKTLQEQRAEVQADLNAIGQGERVKTLAERRQEERDLGVGLEQRRLNAQKLIRAGAIITIATDNYLGEAPEFRRQPKPPWQEAGLGSLFAIEGLVELGMSPAQALVAATKNGAVASQLQKDLGTVEAGKIADLLVLDANPIADISNIRALRTVIKAGRVIDTKMLPTTPVFHSPPAPPTNSRPF